MTGVEYCAKKSVFKDKIFLYSIENKTHSFISDFFENAYEFFSIKTADLLRRFHVIKLNFCLVASFRKEISDECSEFGESNERGNTSDEDTDAKVKTGEIKTYYLKTKNFVVDEGSDLEKVFIQAFEEITSKLDDVQENGSGWTLEEILSLDIYNFKYQCFNGGQFIPLPKNIGMRKAIINIQNVDNQCFKWAILSALHPVDIHAERVSAYKAYANQLNFSGINFPVELKDIEKFEYLNDQISVNVYGLDNNYDMQKNIKVDIVVPLRLAAEVKENHIHLLLLQESVAPSQTH